MVGNIRIWRSGLLGNRHFHLDYLLKTFVDFNAGVKNIHKLTLPSLYFTRSTMPQK